MIKKKRINLFSKTSRKSFSLFFTDKVVLYATISGIMLFIIFVSLNFINFTQKNKIQSLLQEKQKYLKFFIDNQNEDAETKFFLLKKDQLNKFLKDDARFLPYYNVLNESIGIASSTAKIEALSIDKKKNTAFTLSFEDYDAMYNFIKYIESETFTKNFDELTLKSFFLTQLPSSNTNGYKLSFEGLFKNLAVNDVWDE
ncbi:MAG: hypothetical protein HYW86_03565 [Candidatus Roizmanbacteria bacterium]|nr:MAG: hypothetical protein HYW86_03565 [Candidatus Roizmanbacteria bacterium]